MPNHHTSLIWELSYCVRAVFYCFTCAWYTVESVAWCFFYLINMIVPVLKFIFSYVPGVLSLVYAILSLSFKLFQFVFTVAFVLSQPIVAFVTFSIQMIMPKVILEEFDNVITSFSALFNYFTVYILSIALIVTGSLIIATEENLPGRNVFRPKTTVPLCCLAAGLVLHYDHVQANDWVAPVALFTGACWYFISLLYEDISTREVLRSTNLRTTNPYTGRNLPGADTSTNVNHSQSIQNTLDMLKAWLISVWDSSMIDEKSLTPLKLQKVNSKLKTIGDNGDDGSIVILEDHCPICFDDYKNDEVLQCLACCKQCFHSTCIKEWFTNSNKCPMCRAPQTKFGQLVHALFE